MAMIPLLIPSNPQGYDLINYNVKM